jgi:hypothetical protein
VTDFVVPSPFGEASFGLFLSRQLLGFRSVDDDGKIKDTVAAKGKRIVGDGKLDQEGKEQVRKSKKEPVVKPSVTWTI